MKKLFLLIIFFISQTAFACMGNYDCDMGQICVKAQGNVGMDGVCVTPTDRWGNPSNRIPSPSVSPETVRGCMYDTQCGIGGQCVKQSGDMYGICMR